MLIRLTICALSIDLHKLCVGARFLGAALAGLILEKVLWARIAVACLLQILRPIANIRNAPIGRLILVLVGLALLALADSAQILVHFTSVPCASFSGLVRVRVRGALRTPSVRPEKLGGGASLLGAGFARLIREGVLRTSLAEACLEKKLGLVAGLRHTSLSCLIWV